MFGGGPGGPADACFLCHGLKGEGDGNAPRLTGQSAGYLMKQMEDYAHRWRNDPEMTPIALRLSDGDRSATALYYSNLPPAVGSSLPASQPPLFYMGDPTRGIRPCAECHGVRGQGRGLGFPMLAGQPAKYVASQLRAWKASERRNDPQDVMGSIARRLTHAEIEVLAAYVESLP